MTKNAFFWALIGWLVAIVFPPSALFGMVRGVAGGGG